MKESTKKALFEKAAVSVKVACDAFDLSLNSGYAAIKNGEFPSEHIGGMYRIASAWIRKKLQLDGAA
jgi:hypothetical protein